MLALVMADRHIDEAEFLRHPGIVDALDAGETIVVTREGVPIGEIRPLQGRRFVRKAEVLRAFRNAPSLSLDRLRADIDAAVDQDPTPRA